MTALAGPTRNGDQEQPRFREIFEILRDEIGTGSHRVGERLPTEQELCLRFAASRSTVREALRLLQDCGMISRRQGQGSIVVATEPDSRFRSSVSSLQGLVQYASSTRLEVLSVETLLIDESLSDLLQSEPDSPWTRVTALRRGAEDPAPMCYSEIYIPTTYRDVAPDIGRLRQAVYDMIEKRHGVRVHHVTQTMEVGAADANQASRLAVAAGSPVLLINRRYYDQGGAVVEVAVNVHPAGRYTYEMTLQRSDPL